VQEWCPIPDRRRSPFQVDARQRGSYPRSKVRAAVEPAWTDEEDPGLSELLALALGLLIGVAGGALVVSLFQVRPRPPREIRVTVTPNALPRRRASTLAVDHNRLSVVPIGRGGPADPVTLGTAPGTTGRTAPAGAPAMAPGSAPIRTNVLDSGRSGGLVVFPIARQRDAGLDQLRAMAAGSATAKATGGATGSATGSAPVAVALAERFAECSADAPRAGQSADEPGSVPPAPATPPEAPDRSKPGRAPGAPGPATGPCADERRIAAERCDLADRLGEQAAAANHLLREQQRAYDALAVRSAQAVQLADPREIQAAKEAARLAFRHAHAGARSREAVESAAGDWLTEINRINQAARDAAADGQRLRDASAKLALTIEQLSRDADVARINAESAAEACHLAREALAACEEAQVDRRAGRVPVDPAAVPVEAVRPKLIGGPELDTDQPGEITPPSERGFAGGQPRILRMLRGDGEALRAVVAELAAGDQDDQRRWQLLLSNLVDACVARAIEASSLEFPTDHGFWQPFSQSQSRDIATALASLGYRFDGMGGFADGRVPSQRDLSLALGYAGLDPMRMRAWPNETTMAQLFEEVRVAADEYVASTAGDLTLGEMVALLRGRAEPLADLWNNWGRIRPLLLEA